MKRIKIAQISDLHWRGSSRHEEYTRAFTKLYEILCEENPDIIVCTGDIFHTKTQGISPEIVERMVWMLQELMKIAPVRSILGNHDGNLANNSRQDVITPIVRAINSAPMLNLYKESGNFDDEIFPEIRWCNYSCFDKEGWSKCSPDPAKVNIALFHGSIIGCQTDGGFRMMGGEESVNTFHDYDYVLMGDIHKTQYLSYRRSSDGTDKPWIGYPGSLIQQNFGEEETKGFLIWEIEGKNTWDVRFVELPNYQPFVTLPWQGDLLKTQEHIRTVRQDVFLTGTRYRIASSINISDVEKRQLSEWLTSKGAEEATYKIDVDMSVDNIDVANVKIQKTSLRNNPDVLIQLYADYLINNQVAHPLTEDQQKAAAAVINEYMVKLKASEPDVIARDVQWSVRSMDFDNVFRYGEGNSIDFTKLNGIVGIFGPNRIGKALSLKTEIPTTTGWKTIQTVQVGDLVFSADGTPTAVLAKSPVFNNRKCYRVEFSDGSHVTADAEHLWTVEDHFSRTKSEATYQTLTTRQIKRTLTWQNGKKTNAEWSVGTCQPVQWSSKTNKTIHPYVLGCWLGDGTSSSSGFTTADQEIIESFKTLGETVNKHNCKDKNTAYYIRNLSSRLRKIGVLNNKHIPEKYLTASIQDRRLLLAGLLDTDGYCNPSGTVEFANANKRLAENVYELICSLGYKATFKVGKATLYGRYISDKYRIFFTPQEKVFLLDRKNQKCTLTQHVSNPTKKRFITKITEAKREPVQCLVVEHPSHLFLVTRNFIPTHNSSIPGTMMYTLFNATDRGPMKTAHVINKNANDARSRLHITIAGTDYVIERTSQRDEPKRKRKKEVDSDKTSTSLTVTKVLPSGTTVPITGISRDETDKELRRLIGTSEDFLMTSFASQGGMNRFLDEGATERKAILSKFLDLDIFKNLCDYAKTDCGELNGKTKRFSDTQWEQLIDDTKNDITRLEASKLVLETRLVEKRQEVEDLKMWILQKEKEVDMAQIHQLEADLEMKERQLENAQKTFSELNAAIKVKNSELLQIDLRLQGISISELEKKQDNLTELRNLVFELDSSFKVESTTLEHQEKSVRKLELVPCGDQFPQCHFIRDSHENKGKLEAQREIVKSLKEKHESTRALLDAFVTEKISDKIKEHRILSENKQKAESSIRELKTRQKNIDTVRLISEREKIREALETIRESIDESQESEIENQKLKLRAVKHELETLEASRSETLLTLGSKKQKLGQSVSEKEECQEILGQLAVYESIYKAFSKNGIPAMVLKSQLPAINSELDRILSGTVDFRISLETDTSSNVMDVYIEDKDSRRVIEVASGMEKMLTSIALRVALTNLSSLPKSDMFILDEGFGSLDDASLSQCLQLMSLLKSYFRVILVITHIAPIKEIADRIIDIKNDGKCSFVQV